MKFRHKFFYRLLYYPVKLFLYIKFGYTCKKAKNLPDNYIVLSNHVTDYDPLLVGASFPRQMYFVASEHISRWKNAYKILNFVFQPIMRPKGRSAATAIIEIMRKIRSGANICMFAEGVRTWDGVTAPIAPTTGQLVKSSRCGLVTYKLTGGYFISPMWSTSNTRKGYIHGEPVGIYTKEELSKMSVDEINEIIKRDLYEDAYERQLNDPKKYRGKALAEQMENLLFICPECGGYDCITSKGDSVSCSACGKSFRYNEFGFLDGSRFRTVRELSDWQKQCVAKASDDGAIYVAENVTLFEVGADHIKTDCCTDSLSISPSHIVCGDISFTLDEIDEFAMHGRQALVFSVKDKYYEVIPNTHTNMLKFLLFYTYCKNKTKNITR